MHAVSDEARRRRCAPWRTGGLGAFLLAFATLAGAAPPDFTGIWRTYRGAGPFGTDFRASRLEDPPFTDEARRKVAEYRALVEPAGDTPGAFCLGTGMPGSMLGSGAYPMEIIQRPEQITIIYEAHTEVRRIYMDGRKVDPRDIVPSRNGFSVGRWEGDTLVVETTALKEAVDQSTAHSDQAHIVERYRLSKEADGRKVLTAEMTMTDPRFYTRPVVLTKRWQAAEEGAMMMHYECNEPQWLDHLDGLREAAARQE